MKKLKMIVAVIAGIYLLILVAAFFMQDSLVFYPEKLPEIERISA